MGTEFYIKPYGASNYAQIDLEDGIPMPYTYNILDIRNPSKRNAHWSKEIVIPGTKANNQTFEYIFEIGIDDSYNANKKAEVYVLQDSIPTIPYGILQLLSIRRDKQNLDRIYYECAILSGIEDLFTVIGDNDLTELDLSAYDHDYTATVQATSWSASIGVGYVYPMIDYSSRSRAVALSNYDAWHVDDFMPAIYAKYYWDLIFEYAGKTYDSAFIDTDFFKRLIIPFNKDRYQFTEAEIVAREFRAESTAATSNAECYPGTTGARAALNNDSTGTAYDPGAGFNTTTYEFTVPAGKAGYYTLEAGGNLGFQFNGTGTITATTGGVIRSGLSILVYDSGGVIKPGVSTGAGNHPTIATSASYTAGDVDFTQDISLRIDRVYLKAGEKVVLNIFADSHSNLVLSGTSTVNPYLAPGAYLQCFFANELAEESSVALNNCIPSGIKIKDFVNSIIQMFHLHIEVDPDNMDNYIIEPRDAYYTTDVIDWSSKFDYEKGLEIIPMADLQGKEYAFKYKSDKDYYNDLYQKKFSHKGQPRIYGDKYIDVDNDFIKGTNTNELIFSPTPSFGNASNTRVIPAMFTLNGDVPEHKATNIRILYYGGMKSYTGRYWVHYSKNSGTSTGYTTTYPYAGHLDDPFNPTLDLSFGMPAEVNWNIRRQNYTDGNLYNKYHRRFIEEITDPDSRMVTGYFLLTPVDIFNLSFRKLYFFHNDLYRLHSVNDYDLSEYKLVKCEFLKVKDPGVYSVSSLPIYGGGDSVWDGDILPDVVFPKPHNNNSYGVGGAVVSGVDNIIAPNVTGAIVVGNNNSIWANAQNIFIQGNENTISANVQNVTLINTNGVTVAESDTTYINGCEVVGCVEVIPPGG